MSLPIRVGQLSSFWFCLFYNLNRTFKLLLVCEVPQPRSRAMHLLIRLASKAALCLSNRPGCRPLEECVDLTLTVGSLASVRIVSLAVSQTCTKFPQTFKIHGAYSCCPPSQVKLGSLKRLTHTLQGCYSSSYDKLQGFPGSLHGV